MWFTDLQLGETYAYHGKPVVLRQASWLPLHDQTGQDLSCEIEDPVSGERCCVMPGEVETLSPYTLSQDTKTLQGTRNILAYVNAHALVDHGSYERGTLVTCLRKHDLYPHYEPWIAWIIGLTPRGKVRVALGLDGKQVCVTKRAILCPREEKDNDADTTISTQSSATVPGIVQGA